MTWTSPDQFASWERLVIGQEKMPGLASASGASTRDIEILKAKLQDSADIQDNGYIPASLTITVRYLPGDHKEVRRITQKIHPRTSGSNRAPLGIQLEQVNFLGINLIYIQDISTPQISGGEASFTMAVIEYLPPKKKPATKKPAKVSESTLAVIFPTEFNLFLNPPLDPV